MVPDRPCARATKRRKLPQTTGVAVFYKLTLPSMIPPKLHTRACLSVTPTMPKCCNNWDGYTINKAQVSAARNKPLNISKNQSIQVSTAFGRHDGAHV